MLALMQIETKPEDDGEEPLKTQPTQNRITMGDLFLSAAKYSKERKL